MNPRLLAYRTLRELGNQHTDEVIDEVLSKYVLSDKDRRFFTRIVIGVVEDRIYLDYIIGVMTKRNIDEEVREILRIGLYQLLRLSLPDYAAVNESIILAKEIGKEKAKGFVNGILRSFIRNGKKVPLPKEADRRMSVFYSHPLWLVKYWISRFGEENTERLLIANNEKPPLTLRINTVLISVDDYLKLLCSQGIEAERTSLSPSGVHIGGTSGKKIVEFPGYDRGYFIVQDESSQLAIEARLPKDGDFCIDVCCSPGGKTTHMAQYASEVYGLDISRQRLGVAMKNVLRMGMRTKVKLGLADAVKGVRELNDTADYVLVDAPCSALGTIRRNPDIKYNRQAGDIAKNAKMQKMILKRAAQYVKSGGVLVYSTCTITSEENERLVEKFLEKHPDFVLVGQRQLTPFEHGTDGFYFAVMERR